MVALIAAPSGILIAVASVISAIRSSQAAKETRTNGGTSMRDEIQRIAHDVRMAHDHAEMASSAARKAESTAAVAAEGVARADAFHLYMHDRVHDLANGLVGNRSQIAQLRSELGLQPIVPDRREKTRNNPLFPDRMYPPAGEAAPDKFHRPDDEEDR